MLFGLGEEKTQSYSGRAIVVTTLFAMPLPITNIAGQDASALDVTDRAEAPGSGSKQPRASRVRHWSIQLDDMPSMKQERRPSLTAASGAEQAPVLTGSPPERKSVSKRRSSTGSVASPSANRGSSSGGNSCDVNGPRTPLYQLLGYRSEDDAPPALRRFTAMHAALAELSSSAEQTTSPSGLRNLADSASLTYMELQAFKAESSSWSAAFDRLRGKVIKTIRKRPSKSVPLDDDHGAIASSGPASSEERNAMAREQVLAPMCVLASLLMPCARSQCPHIA